MDGAVALPVRVRNMEGAARSYAWTATVNLLGATPQPVARGRLALDDGAERVLRVRVPVSCAGERLRVAVSIGGTHRAVGVWVPCDGTTG